MNINFDYLEEPIKIEGLTSLSINNASIFAKIVESLYHYKGESDYVKIFDNKFNTTKAIELMVVADVLGFDANSASIKKLVYTDLELQISDNPLLKTEIEGHIYGISRLISNELVDFELDLAFEKITFTKLFTAMGIQIEESETIFERMLDIVQIYKYLSKKNLLVFISCGAYLTKVQVQELEEYISLQNINVLMLDSLKVNEVKNLFVLDDDYVLLKGKMV